jgi:hypothetical protein
VLDAGESRVGEHRAALVDRFAAGETPLHHRPEDHVLEVALPREQRPVLEHDDTIRSGIRFRLLRRAQDFAVHHDTTRRDRVEAGDRVQ